MLCGMPGSAVQHDHCATDDYNNSGANKHNSGADDDHNRGDDEHDSRGHDHDE